MVNQQLGRTEMVARQAVKFYWTTPSCSAGALLVLERTLSADAAAMVLGFAWARLVLGVQADL